MYELTDAKVKSKAKCSVERWEAGATTNLRSVQERTCFPRVRETIKPRPLLCLDGEAFCLTAALGGTQVTVSAQSTKPVRHPTTVRDKAPPVLAFLPLLSPAVTVIEKRIRGDDTKKQRNY